MKAWPVQDAKARFSELLEATQTDGPQMVTKRGVETAVLVPVAEWRRLQQKPRIFVKDVLLGPGPRFEMKLPKRGRLRRRPPIEFD